MEAKEVRMKLFEDWPHNWFGYWRDGSGPEPTNVPLLTEIIDTGWQIDDRAQIVAYLEACPCAQSAGRPLQPCSLCGEDPIDPSLAQTDGVWIWPGRLPHMVIQHSVRLPDRMVEHIRLRAYVPPGRENGTGLNLDKR